ncbi:KptA family-domain-containing protein [Mycena rosella]|uniref:2'-phosphotransferase n=1 Tax=Mycena rosella TaxID=1033263 RepID=A0AAD7H0A8_MYCRO|nr:KptA family-domain-containing protein [Mycena rosella]
MLRTLPRHKFVPAIPRTSSTPPAAKRPFPAGKARKGGQDPREVRISRELSYLLRHGAKSEGLPIRSDGYADVDVLLRHRSLRGVDFPTLESVVRNDSKSRYHLLYEPRPGTVSSWWIRANQGHSMTDISLDLRRIETASEIPMAVHGTSLRAWESISKQGLSRMSRNHVHFAQGFEGTVISGMRSSSEVLIFLNVELALANDIKLYVSSNDVVLTPGNDMGYIEPRFFGRVERIKFSANPLPGWEARDEDDEMEENHQAPESSVDPVDERSKTAKQRREARAQKHAALIRELHRPELGFV